MGCMSAVPGFCYAASATAAFCATSEVSCILALSGFQVPVIIESCGMIGDEGCRVIASHVGLVHWFSFTADGLRGLSRLPRGVFATFYNLSVAIVCIASSLWYSNLLAFASYPEQSVWCTD